MRGRKDFVHLLLSNQHHGSDRREQHGDMGKQWQCGPHSHRRGWVFQFREHESRPDLVLHIRDAWRLQLLLLLSFLDEGNRHRESCARLNRGPDLVFGKPRQLELIDSG
jgi:hypothetical protein